MAWPDAAQPSPLLQLVVVKMAVERAHPVVERDGGGGHGLAGRRAAVALTAVGGEEVGGGRRDLVGRRAAISPFCFKSVILGLWAFPRAWLAIWGTKTTIMQRRFLWAWS